jgi:hypothetical protein
MLTVDNHSSSFHWIIIATRSLCVHGNIIVVVWHFQKTRHVKQMLAVDNHSTFFHWLIITTRFRVGLS